MAVVETIVARSDPYTIVIVPNIRGPLAYNVATGFSISVGELAQVDTARADMMPISGFAPGPSAGRFYVTSGSGNIVTLEVWPGHLPTAPFGGMPLSHWSFKLEAWGH